MEGNASISPVREGFGRRVEGMESVAERTFTLPTHLIRRAVSPGVCAGLSTMLVTLISLLLRRTWRPQLPRMSEAWLRSHDLDFDRYDQWREY